MKIAIDCDCAAPHLKRSLLEHVRARGFDIVDLAHLASHPENDYPDVAFNLARRIRDGEFERGILLCGTGQGMAMSACKVKGVYAGACSDVYSAERLRKSNDAQIIALGERVVGVELAKMIIDAWLGSEFQGGSSSSKVARMRQLEAEAHERPDQSQVVTQ